MPVGDKEEHKLTATGPKIEDGSVTVPVTFDEPGEFTVTSILQTMVKDSEGTILAEDYDEVTTIVEVFDGPTIMLLHPENEAVLPKSPAPIFEWASFGYHKFKLQFSTSPGFDNADTLT